MSCKVRLLVLTALAAAAAAFLKRPIRPPAAEGSWQPVDSTPSRG